MESHRVTSPADVDRIAHHFATSATLVDELGFVADMPDEIHGRALKWLEKAVDQAEAGELYPVVVKLTTHALELRRVPRTTLERFLLARARARINMRQLDEAAPDLDAAMQSANEADDDVGRAATLTARGDLEQKIGDLERSLSRLGESVEAFTEIGDSGGLGWATGLLAFVRYHQGRYAEAETMAERMYVEAGQRGDRWAEGMMRVLLAMLGLWTGRADEAVPHGEAAYRLFTGMRDWYGEMISAGVLGRALIAGGRIDDGFDV